MGDAGGVTLNEVQIGAKAPCPLIANVDGNHTNLGTVLDAMQTAIEAGDFEEGISLIDDMKIVLGTTTTNAETTVTMEFDETTTGIGLFRMGDLTNAQVLNTNPGAAVIGSIVNILHSEGAGDCNDLIASYDKVAVSGDGDAGITIVGHASRAYVGITGGENDSVADECYGSQPWAKHEGTGAIVAMSGLSAKLDVSADAFTATTVNAGHFHIEGAAAVTGQFDGVRIEVYEDVTSMDSALKLALAGTVTNAISISGAPTYFVDFNACSGVNGSIISDGGSEASTFKARIKVKTNDGTDGWINVYSVSNESA